MLVADLGDTCSEMKKIYFRVSEETNELTLVILMLYTSQQNYRFIVTFLVFFSPMCVFLLWSLVYSRKLQVVTTAVFIFQLDLRIKMTPWVHIQSCFFIYLFF